MNFLKSKLGLSILLLFLVASGLSGWGLAQSSSAKKQIDNYDAMLQQQLQQSQSLESDQSQQSPAASSSSPSSSSTTSTPSSSTSSSKKTGTSTGSPSTTSSPAPLSDAAKQQATEQVYSISGRLEAYWATNDYYPSDINPSTFSGDSCTGDGCTSMFTPPAEVKFVYTPTPSGCTTSAQNCQHFTLEAVDSGGNVIFSKNSFE